MSITDFFKYKVKKGDTFTKIGERLKVHPYDLRTFHNTHAAVSERAYFETLDVEYIYLPINYRKFNNALKNDLAIRPAKEFTPNFYAKSYKVTEFFEDLEKENIEINYGLKINFTQENNQTIVHLYRFDFKVNGNKLETNLGELTEACYAILEPLSFVVSTNGEITGVHQSKDRMERFRAVRSSLEEYYSGENTKLFLDLIENNLSNDTYFLKQFVSTPLFQLLFPKRDWFYKTSSWEESFYFTANSFPVRCEAETIYNEENKALLETEIKATSVEECSLQDVLRGIKLAQLTEGDYFEGELFLKYTTDKATKQLIEAKTTRIIEDENQVKQRYSLILKHL